MPASGVAQVTITGTASAGTQDPGYNVYLALFGHGTTTKFGDTAMFEMGAGFFGSPGVHRYLGRPAVSVRHQHHGCSRFDHPTA